MRSLDELLAKADVVSLHVDGRPGNAGFFGAEQFAKMKPRSIFINAARGMVVDNESLRDHILSGHIAGAALDVFPVEPKAQGDEFESVLRGLDNVILTPHVGGSTQEAQEEIGYFVAGKLAGFSLEGRTELSVNVPAVLAPQLQAGHRIGFLHVNVPGVLAGVNGILADSGANVTGQYLSTRGEQGYVVTDTLDPLPADSLAKLAESEHTIWLQDLGRLMLTGVRERLGNELFARVAGPDGARHAERIHFRDGPRWFEADSPIARVHGDASMFIGGIRALLLQTLHPAAMRGVAEHSGFRGDMWGRLARTSRFLAVTTFGTADDAQQAVDMVRSDPRARDRHHARRHDVRRLRPAPAGAGCTSPRSTASCGPTRSTAATRSPAPTATATSPRPPRSPGDSAWSTRRRPRPSSRGHLAAYRPELRGTPEAREAVSYLLFRPPLPLVARAPYGVLVAAAVGLMPRWTRRPLRLPWLPVSERTVVRALGGLATGTIRWAMAPSRDDQAALSNDA